MADFFAPVWQEVGVLTCPFIAIPTTSWVKECSCVFFGLVLALIFGVVKPGHAQFAFGEGGAIKLEGDRVEFLRDQGVVVATGRVHVQEGDVHIYADQLRYDLESQQLTADGTVTWQQENQEVRCEKFTYNIKTKKGKADDVQTNTAPWYFRGRDVLFEENRIQLTQYHCAPWQEHNCSKCRSLHGTYPRFLSALFREESSGPKNAIPIRYR
jgi:hypothetical protein